MKTEWYIVKKKSAKNWTAFELDSDNLPELRTGYQMKGPFKSMLQAFINSNK